MTDDADVEVMSLDRVVAQLSETAEGREGLGLYLHAKLQAVREVVEGELQRSREQAERMAEGAVAARGVVEEHEGNDSEEARRVLPGVHQMIGTCAGRVHELERTGRVMTALLELVTLAHLAEDQGDG